MQSSYIRNKPHEICDELIVSSTIKIESFACSCAAGASESCKHVVGVLLFLNRYHNIYHKHILAFFYLNILILIDWNYFTNRNPLKDIDTLSTTYVQCQWSKLKEPSLK